MPRHGGHRHGGHRHRHHGGFGHHRHHHSHGGFGLGIHHRHHRRRHSYDYHHGGIGVVGAALGVAAVGAAGVAIGSSMANSSSSSQYQHPPPAAGTTVVYAPPPTAAGTTVVYAPPPQQPYPQQPYAAQTQVQQQYIPAQPQPVHYGASAYPGSHGTARRTDMKPKCFRELPPDGCEPEKEKDDVRDNCPYCHRDFGLFLWRRHCKRCGVTLCDSCSRYMVIPKLYNGVSRRVCPGCQYAAFSNDSKQTVSGDNLQQQMASNALPIRRHSADPSLIKPHNQSMGGMAPPPPHAPAGNSSPSAPPLDDISMLPPPPAYTE